MFEELFEPDYGVDNSPPDGTDIFQFILYYSEDELAEVKELLKTGIKTEFPSNPQEGNASDLIKLLLKRLYGGKDNAHLNHEAEAKREVASNVLGG